MHRIIEKQKEALGTFTVRRQEWRRRKMRNKLIIDGNAVYEIDDECIAAKEKGKEEAAARPAYGSGQGKKRPGGRYLGGNVKK